MIVDEVASHDEKYFELALKEIETNNLSSGLWAKALANTEGDETKAKAFYLKERASQLELFHKKKIKNDFGGEKVNGNLWDLYNDDKVFNRFIITFLWGLVIYSVVIVSVPRNLSVLVVPCGALFAGFIAIFIPVKSKAIYVSVPFLIISFIGFFFVKSA